MSDTLSPLFSFLGWSFLPNLATQFLQSLYYRITLPAGTLPPQPGTPLHIRDYRRIRITVLVLYLFYTLLQSLYDVKRQGDFYTILYLTPSATDKEIRTRQRRLAAKFHPDKSSSPQDESIFLALRRAGETLTTPGHRYAYLHFGPDVLLHLPEKDRGNTGNLVIAAMRQKIPSYLSTLVFVFALNRFFLGDTKGRFWRYMIITASFLVEFWLLTHELPGWIDGMLAWVAWTKLGDIVPDHLLPFQVLQVVESLGISLNIFASQVGALFPGSVADEKGLQRWMGGMVENLGTLAAVGQRVENEAGGLLQLQFAPYRGQRVPVRDLRRGMKEGMVIGSVRGHPEVQAAVKQVVDQRKNSGKGDGADVVDLLNSDEQFD